MNLVRSINSHLTIDQLISMVRRFYKNDIARKSMMTLTIQGIARFLRFVFWILVARVFTTSIVGELVFGLTMANVFSNLFVMGGDVIVAREWGYSKLGHKNKLRMAHELINGFFYRGMALTGVLFVGYYLFLSHSKHAAFMQLNLLMLAFIVPYFIMALTRAFFIAIQKVFIANLLDLVLSISILAPMIYFYKLKHYNAPELLLTVLAIIAIVSLTLMITSVMYYGVKPQRAEGSQLGLVLLKVGNVLYSFVDLAVLKVFSDSVNVAHYGIALQLSVTISFGLAAINQNIMSKVAQSYKSDTKEVFQKKLTSYTKIVFIFTMIPVLLLTAFGPFIFQIYGESYQASYPILLILMVGNLVNAMSGSARLILTMTRHEKHVAKAFWQCMFLNVVLATILVHFFAAIGVAISTAISLVAWNLILYFKVKRLLGVDPSVVYLIRSLHRVSS